MIAALCGVALVLAALYLLSGSSNYTAQGASTVSKAAADRCHRKLLELESYAALKKPGDKKATRFSQQEVNSYLALNLSPKYHPSLKSLVMDFQERKLKSVVTVDFDRLGDSSNSLFPKLIGALFSGVHTISAQGQLNSGSGKAHFILEQAQFDDRQLSTTLVETLITSVGRKQNPPFDPLSPSELPYDIEKVDVHSGYIVVHQ